MDKQSLVFKLINQIVDLGIDIVKVDINEKAVDNTPNVPSALKIRRKVKFQRLDGDGDQMTSVLSPTGEDNVPVANVVARYAALGVELIDRDILEDRLNGMSLDQAAEKYKMDRVEIRKREVRVAAAMREMGEQIPSDSPSDEKLGPTIGGSRRARVGSLSKPASPSITATEAPKKRGRPPLSEAVQAERRAAKGPVRAKRGRKRLTEAERSDIVSDIQSGVPFSEIISKYSISPTTLSKITKASGLSGKTKKGAGTLRIPIETRDAIFKDFDENPSMTVNELAAKYSVDPKSVLRVLRNSSVGEDGKRKSTANEKTNAIADRLINTNDSLQDIAKDFGVSRQYLDMIGKKLGIRTTGRNLKYQQPKPEPPEMRELREFVRQNPSVTLNTLKDQFPGIGIEALRSERNKIIGVTKDTRMTSAINQVTKLYDELAYDGMTTDDRTALAGIIAEQLEMPVNRVSLLISRISNKNKSKRGNKLPNAVREYEAAVRKNPSAKKGELLAEIAKKYDTTPGSILSSIQARQTGEGKGRGAEVIAAFTKRAEDENFFTRRRFAVYEEIGKEIGMSAARVQGIISQYSRVKYPDKKAKADFKKANITPRDYRMLKSLVNGVDIAKIAKSNKVSEKEVRERTNLLKKLLLKHNKPLMQWDKRDQDAPTPLPLPPSRTRYWTEMSMFKDDADPVKSPARAIKPSGRKIPKKSTSTAPGVEKHDARFKAAYGTDSPDGSGNCYESAVSTAQTIGKRLGVPDSSLRIVHGAPLGTGGDAQGIRYGHAWVEVASNGWDDYDRVTASLDKVVDESKTAKDPARIAELRKQYNELIQKLIQIEAEDIKVYDYSNGNRHELPRMLYYAFGNIERQNAMYYPISDAFNAISTNGHYGPWG